jgi:hypothetical protein
MSTFHDFLQEHAKFPFPHPDEDKSIDATTDISKIEAGLLEKQWKASRLCETIPLFISFALLSTGSLVRLLYQREPKIISYHTFLQTYLVSMMYHVWSAIRMKLM